MFNTEFRLIFTTLMCYVSLTQAVQASTQMWTIKTPNVSAKSNSLQPSKRSQMSEDVKGRVALDNFPLVDGHNDLPLILQQMLQNQLKNYDINNNVTGDSKFNCSRCTHTDLPKLKAGKVGAQFWAAYVDCSSQYKDVVARTLEQIDVIKRLARKYPNDLQFVITADGILSAFKKKKIGCLIGVEGGHHIQYRLSVLRAYYELGARYMTITHACNIPWADASPLDLNSVNNLTNFGEKVILEMNRLGMLVDLSHVSYHVMNHALSVTKAPVIFSHSSVHAIFSHHRNVRDDILKKLKKNKGIIMVNFYTNFVGAENLTIKTVVDHINHAVDMCGIRCVGLGADYNGVEKFPKGLEDVAKYPELFDLLRELKPQRWTIANLEKLAGRNLVRVFKEVEKVRDKLHYMDPIEDWIPEDYLSKITNPAFKQCTTDGKTTQN